MGLRDDWCRMDLSRPPEAPGVYAIKRGSEWLYIGSSQNIAKRIRVKRHPVQITLGLPGLSYWWMWEDERWRSLEYWLIEQHSPDWNGRTASSDWGGNSRGPHCEWCAPIDNDVILAAIEAAA